MRHAGYCACGEALVQCEVCVTHLMYGCCACSEYSNSVHTGCHVTHLHAAGVDLEQGLPHKRSWDQARCAEEGYVAGRKWEGTVRCCRYSAMIRA